MSGRVLFTASTAAHIRSFHLPYLRAFRELGYEVDVACGACDGDIPGAGRVIPLPFQKRIAAPANFRAAAILRQELRRTPYDLIVAHTSLAAFFTRLANSGKDRAPLVNVVHGYLFAGETSGLKDRLLLRAEELTAGRTDLVLTMNKTDLDTARSKALGAQVDFIPGMGVDFARLTPPAGCDKAALRRELGVPEDAFVFLYPAEFSKRKDQATLLRATARLPKRAVLALPGQGALLEPCKALAQELGLGERVIFPGQVSAMAPWYALADAGVSVSRSEGLPFNVMEAMYAGLPVAATAVKGHTDLLTDGGTGLLFPAGDAGACAGAMARLMDSPALCQALGAAAHEAVLPYGLDAVLPQVMARYLSLLPARAPAAV